jgi:hypothetical protein
MSPRKIAVLILGLGALAAQPGRAEDPQREADRLIRHGIELRKALDDEAAAREFQKAYDLVRTPRAAAQLGLAEQALGRWEDAERHVREALRAPDDPWVAHNRGTLAETMSTIQSHLGRVEVNGDPPGAHVSVNGRPVGDLPLEQAVIVSAGDVDIELRAPGYRPAQRTVRLVAGQYQRVVVHLTPESLPGPAHVDAPPPVEPAASSAVAATVQASAPAPAAPAGSASITRRVVKWTAGGLALAGLAVGATFTVRHYQNVSAFDAHDPPCADDNGKAVLQGSGAQAPAQCQHDLDAYRLDTQVAIGAYVAAGAFAATWLILQLTDDSGPASSGEHAFWRPACAPWGAGVGLSCAARF